MASGPSPQAVQRHWHDPAAGALALAAVVTVPVTRTGTGSLRLRSAAGREELASVSPILFHSAQSLPVLPVGCAG